MRRLVYDDDQRLLGFVEERLARFNTAFGPFAHAIGVERDGAVAAAAVFDRFTPDDCEVSFALAPGCRLSRGFLVACAAYAFLQLGLARVTVFPELGNERSVQLCRRLGFRLEGMKRNPEPGRTVAMYGLLRRECRWLPVRRAQRGGLRAAA